MHPDVDRASLGLFPIRSHLWQDIIFVNIDGQAAEFRDCNSDLLQRWREFDRPVFHGGTESSFSFEVKTNWKLAVENYCESYHLPWVHPGLNSYSKLEDHYNISVRNSFSGQGTKVYRQLKSETGLAFPDFPALSEKWDRGAEYIAVYPNVLLGVHRDHSFAIILEPVDCANTIEHIELYYTDMIVTSPEYDQLRNENARLWKAVFQEDLFVVEGMQRGRSGVLFDGGRFSPEMDEPTHNFHYWVAQQVDQKRHRASGS